MSLEEFNRLVDPGAERSMARVAPPTVTELKKAEGDFFSEVDQGAKKIVNRERIRESIHKMHLVCNIFPLNFMRLWYRS